jgi:hypothetical protein
MIKIPPFSKVLTPRIGVYFATFQLSSVYFFVPSGTSDVQCYKYIILVTWFVIDLIWFIHGQ